MIIRETGDADRPEVLDVVRAAFPGGGVEEVKIVENVWSLPAYLPDLDLVALDDDGSIAGHVLCSRARVGDRDAVAVAPLCVRPDRQRTGVGGALMTEVLRRADDAGAPLVGLLGHPSYYPRFGFERAVPLGIETPWPMPDDTPFMVRRLHAYEPSCRGPFRYAWQPGFE